MRYPISPSRYDGGAVLLHWLVVLLLAAQFVIAWTMPPMRRGTPPDGLIGLHLSVGVLIMLVVIIRLVWRIFHRVPPAADNLPSWQRQVGAATHLLLYVLLLVTPVLGWVAASARGYAVGLFGLFALPPLLPQGARIGPLVGDIHTVVSYGLLGLVGLHLLAVLYHRLVLRDGVLARMVPGVK